MQLLSQIKIPHQGSTALIQLLHGDLAAIPKEHATDILVMSAFPGDYSALPGSLIRALYEKGLSVEALAADKEVDLRSQLNCWLSGPLTIADQHKFNFKQVLCFEPGDKIKAPEESVGDVFRCINSFAFDEDKNEIAMPIIGTGYQKIPLGTILPALLQAAIFWLTNGLPLRSLKLVAYREEQAKEALKIFEDFKKDMQSDSADIIAKEAARGGQARSSTPKAPGSSPFHDKIRGGAGKQKVTKNTIVNKNISDKRYDYFLSYAHVHSKEIQYFVNELKKKKKDLSVFYDKDSIPPGGLWIQQISAAIQQAEKILVFLSPDYDHSPVCWDEFQCAKLLEYNRKKNIIQTVYLYGYKETEMPLIMGIYSYVDCREGNEKKINDCIDKLLA